MPDPFPPYEALLAVRVRRECTWDLDRLDSRPAHLPRQRVRHPPHVQAKICRKVSDEVLPAMSSADFPAASPPVLLSVRDDAFFLGRWLVTGAMIGAGVIF